jgi:plastocyanin
VRYHAIAKAIAIVVLGSFAFSVAGYSFVAAQNVTGPAGNITVPGNTTGTANATAMDNQTRGAPSASEINTFNARGQIASVISDPAGDNASAEVVGGRLRIDVIDGEVRRVEINMTMAKPDGSDFHTLLVDNFTAGTGKTTISNATNDNMTGGNTTTVSGDETTQRFLQVITGGNQTGNATTLMSNATGNQTTPAANATAPAGTGNETTLAQATLSQDGTFEISGSATIYLNGNPQWEDVPIMMQSAGRVITINVDHEMTDNHFKGMPIYGFITALIGEVGGQRQSILPPVTTEAPAAPAGPTASIVPNATGNATAPTGNATGNQTSEENQTITIPTPAASPSGGTIEVSITPGSSSKTDDAYDPNPVHATVGATVIWTNDDTTPHTVTSGTVGVPDDKFDSSPGLNPLMAPGATFEHTFAEAGEFPYYCALHPNMVGTVSVS